MTISFFIPIKDEVDRIDNLLTNLRNFYPNERVVLYCNGTNEINVDILKQKSNDYKTEIIFTKCIYNTKKAGKLFRDMFNWYIQNPTDILLRLDTDADVYKKIQDFTGYENSVFGTVHRLDENKNPLPNTSNNKILNIATNVSNPYTVVMPTFVNGVIGFDSISINTFIENNIFSETNDEEYYNSFKTLKGISNGPSDYISMDFVLCEGIKKTNIRLLDHPEIYSVTFSNFLHLFYSNMILDSFTTLDELNNKEKYAFVHPVNRNDKEPFA